MIPQLTPEQLLEAAALFQSFADDCVPYVNEKKFPGCIFWMKDGKYMFEYNEKYIGKFWVRHSIWLDFKSKFNLDYTDTSNLLKPLVESTFKLGRFAPCNAGHERASKIEDFFKSEKLMQSEPQQPKKEENKDKCECDTCQMVWNNNQPIITKEPYWKIERNGSRTDYAYCPENNQYLDVTQYSNMFGPSIVFCAAPEAHMDLKPSDAETFFFNYRKTVAETFRLIPLNNRHNDNPKPEKPA